MDLWPDFLKRGEGGEPGNGDSERMYGHRNGRHLQGFDEWQWLPEVCGLR